jgi:hypothetical protein
MAAISTANDIINSALRKIGVLDQGETPSANESADALTALNVFVDNLALDNIMSIAQTAIGPFPTVAGTPNYTIGANETINVLTPPLKINSAVYADTFQNVFDLDILTREQYYSYEDRLIITGPPTGLFYDEGATQQANATGTIWLYPTPDTSGPYQVTMQCDVAFAEFASLTAAYTFPSGYARMFIFNFALDMESEYPGCQITDDMRRIARDSKNLIRRVNSKTPIATFEFGGGGQGVGIITAGDWMRD